MLTGSPSPRTLLLLLLILLLQLLLLLLLLMFLAARGLALITRRGLGRGLRAPPLGTTSALRTLVLLLLLLNLPESFRVADSRVPGVSGGVVAVLVGVPRLLVTVVDRACSLEELRPGRRAGLIRGAEGGDLGNWLLLLV